MGIIIKNALVETHYFIIIVERYYRSLWQIYSIITTEIVMIKPNLALQMFFKFITNSMGLNSLVLTLLVFDIYFRMIEQKALSLLILQRFMALQKTMDKFKKSIIFC